MRLNQARGKASSRRIKGDFWNVSTVEQKCHVLRAVANVAQFVACAGGAMCDGARKRFVGLAKISGVKRHSM